MAESPLSVLFLWHQHQPLYKDDVTHRYEMPWVRLHATKDYYDMVALLDEFPTLKSNFNLVPSLLRQLDDYAQGIAQDKFYDLTLKKPAELTLDDKLFLLQNFFMANWEHMVDPYPRYRELLDKRGRTITPESLARTQNYFKEQDWRDLQTWFNLTWFDPLWREKDPVLRALFEKGKNFSEDDKKILLSKQLEICGKVAGKHKEAQDRGQIEITTTPFYHPILPLLCDSETAKMSQPDITLPSNRFRHPEDAREQLKKAVDDYQRRFGKAPQGMWPSEGSVSEEAARLIADTGLRWIATDEEVLARSLGDDFERASVFQPYRLALGEKNLHFFFRDHALSDAIGFTYGSWDPEDAAKDFIHKLLQIRTSLKGKSGSHVVPVILDGENCWEYYRQDGLPFLRALYRRLAAEPALETVRGSDFLDGAKDIKTLPKLWSGSWIHANFSIWIGHAEDNTAWNLLYRTREFLVRSLKANPALVDTDKAKQAWEELYIAEGSDWCWWYGDDHASAYDTTFDYLFRKHLINIYTLLGEKAPDDLHLPIKIQKQAVELDLPVDFIEPLLDGKVSSYFEWKAAGHYITEAGATGTMHKAENFIKAIYYGFDLTKIYLRLDPNRELKVEQLKGIKIKVSVLEPEKAEFLVNIDEDGKLRIGSEVVGAYAKIFEFCLTLSELMNATKKPFRLSIVLLKDDLEQERWPSGATLLIPYPDSSVFIDNWHV